ncbi:MAG: hypothetical protein HQL51_03535 [Magnetococcales bacterium]|nr:hypothetical protein [Magnetococcales bacterium]
MTVPSPLGGLLAPPNPAIRRRRRRLLAMIVGLCALGWSQHWQRLNHQRTLEAAAALDQTRAAFKRAFYRHCPQARSGEVAACPRGLADYGFPPGVPLIQGTFSITLLQFPEAGEIDVEVRDKRGRVMAQRRYSWDDWRDV